MDESVVDGLDRWSDNLKYHPSVMQPKHRYRLPVDMRICFGFATMQRDVAGGVATDCALPESVRRVVGQRKVLVPHTQVLTTTSTTTVYKYPYSCEDWYSHSSDALARSSFPIETSTRSIMLSERNQLLFSTQPSPSLCSSPSRGELRHATSFLLRSTDSCLETSPALQIVNFALLLGCG